MSKVLELPDALAELLATPQDQARALELLLAASRFAPGANSSMPEKAGFDAEPTTHPDSVLRELARPKMPLREFFKTLEGLVPDDAPHLPDEAFRREVMYQDRP